MNGFIEEIHTEMDPAQDPAHLARILGIGPPELPPPDVDFGPNYGDRPVAFAGNGSMDMTHLEVHRVYCSNSDVDGEDHSDHPATSDFLDVPRLHLNDTRGSALRGTQIVPDQGADGFWDDKPVIVTKMYSCEAYHQRVKRSFQLISLGPKVVWPSKLRPWIVALKDSGPPCVPFSESIGISKSLNDALSDFAAAKYPEMGMWDQQQDLRAPYDYFYHFRHKLRDQGPSFFGRQRHQELLVLLDYVDSSQGIRFDEADHLLDKGRVDRNIFSKLFAPNEIVITQQDGHPKAYLAERATFRPKAHGQDAAVELQCWSWEFDGSFRKRDERIMVFWPPSDPREIQIDSLFAWPLRLDKSGIEARLLKRGRDFWSCRKRRLVSYDSPTPTIFELQVTNPKYMIDYRTYRQMHPDGFKRPPLTIEEMKETGIDFDDDEPPSDLFCLLLPSTMSGYAFHDKRWRSLSVEHTRQVPWNHDAFHRLVLDPDKKEAIRALISVHLTTIPERQDMDIVENKGNGLIILLHGPPGTGKTLTAESVAELAEKPLYRVTCGDLGTTAENVEKYLETVLLLGGIWGCVVLLDEADVFLEERQVTDLARNALVSVFLRVLEYYDGILILTTNRVGHFDEAFKSRVQLAIHYPQLDEAGRDEIWFNFLGDLQKRKIPMEYNELKSKVRTLSKIPFNGRQIRNNLWAAAQMAKYKNEPLSYAHLAKVVKISEEFESYLRQTHHGKHDEEVAHTKGIRFPGASNPDPLLDMA
jgi:hypothetical protein